MNNTDQIKTLIAAEFAPVQDIEAAVEIYYDLRRFLTKAFSFACADIAYEQEERAQQSSQDCLTCKGFIGCEGGKIIFHRSSGIPCEDFEQILSEEQKGVQDDAGES